MILTLSVFGKTFAQGQKAVTGGIVNGRASYLPTPDYPQKAKDFCAAGKVEVEVLIDEDGSVIEARAISGDEFLHDSAIEAAEKAKFRTEHSAVKIRGLVVYNFDSFAKCIDVKVVNEKALAIPKPQVNPKHLKIKHEEIVEVQLIIESLTGKVIRARAVSGLPILRAACEKSARQAKFSPVNDLPLNIPAKAILIYKFKPDGTIEF